MATGWDVEQISLRLWNNGCRRLYVAFPANARSYLDRRRRLHPSRNVIPPLIPGKREGSGSTQLWGATGPAGASSPLSFAVTFSAPGGCSEVPKLPAEVPKKEIWRRRPSHHFLLKTSVWESPDLLIALRAAVDSTRHRRYENSMNNERGGIRLTGRRKEWRKQWENLEETKREGTGAWRSKISEG